MLDTTTDSTAVSNAAAGVACECEDLSCHSRIIPYVRCGEQVPDSHRCSRAARWVVRVRFECGMNHHHDETRSLCDRCLADRWTCEFQEGTIEVVWAVPLIA